MILNRRAIKGKYWNYRQSGRVIFGFTEMGFTWDDLVDVFPGFALLELKQTHSGIIHSTADIVPGLEGDGIILGETGTMAVIKTADCIPLFFWDETFSRAGIIHVGWRGLYEGIELNLLSRLERIGIPRSSLHFFIGPAIERHCYEVGPELAEKFSEKPYGRQIFFLKKNGQYDMDLPAGLVLSLKGAGIGDDRIENCRLCTFCLSERFPSFRRDRQTGARIYNFLTLSQPDRLFNFSLTGGGGG